MEFRVTLHEQVRYRGSLYIIRGYSYSLSHSWTLWWRVRWLKRTVPSWGRGGTAAVMAQNEQTEPAQYAEQDLGNGWASSRPSFIAAACAGFAAERSAGSRHRSIAAGAGAQLQTRAVSRWQPRWRGWTQNAWKCWKLKLKEKNDGGWWTRAK